MSTFLEICQKVASKSGTVSGSGLPVAVTGQTGRLSEIVEWVVEAWTDVQNSNDGTWRWMRKEFSGTSSSGTSKYTAAGWNITDFASWVTEDEATTAYLASLGVSDEGALRNIDWSDWRKKYGRGTQTNKKPAQYAISPQNEFCLGPIPDDSYVINGEYFKTAQILADNADVPDCPARFHDIIMHRALMFLHAYDESPVGFAEAKSNHQSMLFDLQRDQLPKFTIGGEPLA